jgi:hypothetical protein
MTKSNRKQISVGSKCVLAKEVLALKHYFGHVMARSARYKMWSKTFDNMLPGLLLSFLMNMFTSHARR